MRVVKIYFSPTGNTKKIVDAVASGMAGDGVNGVGVGIGLNLVYSLFALALALAVLE